VKFVFKMARGWRLLW